MCRLPLTVVFVCESAPRHVWAFTSIHCYLWEKYAVLKNPQTTEFRMENLIKECLARQLPHGRRWLRRVADRQPLLRKTIRVFAPESPASTDASSASTLSEWGSSLSPVIREQSCYLSTSSLVWTIPTHEGHRHNLFIQIWQHKHSLLCPIHFAPAKPIFLHLGAALKIPFSEEHTLDLFNLSRWHSMYFRHKTLCRIFFDTKGFESLILLF